MNIRGRFIGFFIAAIVALAAVFFGHLFLFEQWRAQQERQVHRAKILNQVAHVQRLVLEVETNFRGYLLTEQQSFLEPIRLAENQLSTALAQLAELTTTTPGLQAGVRVLSARLEEFVESKQRLLAVIGAEQQSLVHSYVRGGSGRALFLTIEKAIGDFEVRIDRALPSEPMTYDSWLERVRWQLLLMESMGVMVCVFLTKAALLPNKTALQPNPRLLL